MSDIVDIHGVEGVNDDVTHTFQDIEEQMEVEASDKEHKRNCIKAKCDMSDEQIEGNRLATHLCLHCQ